MTIHQPDDKTLTKERIEAILIALNYLWMKIDYPKDVHTPDAPELYATLNEMPNLKGQFTLSEKGEIVFVAQ